MHCTILVPYRNLIYTALVANHECTKRTLRVLRQNFDTTLTEQPPFRERTFVALYSITQNLLIAQRINSIVLAKYAANCSQIITVNDRCIEMSRRW